GGRDPFGHFGNPFGSFGGFSSFDGFGGHRRIMPSFFGGRNPFDDPFFASPFGTMFNQGFMGSPFVNTPVFTNPEPPPPRRLTRPVIEELNSDEEKDDVASRKEDGTDAEENPRKHRRSNESPIVEDIDDEIFEKRNKRKPNSSYYVNQVQDLPSRPQSHSFSFHSSTVSYGGANGTFYTSSRRRRTGSDGLMFEESKEADSSTGRATHRLTRGIHDKGHSVTRNLTSDGHVNTMQTLHNLDEDGLLSFDEAWKGNSRKHLP
ncbi:hypothetical protein M569_13128, partial [Genlisea aurea]